MNVRYVLAFAAITAFGCDSADPWNQPARFVVLPLGDADTARGDAVHVGVAWVPPGEAATIELTDVAAVPSLSRDFAWTPAGPPPISALRTCSDFGCAPAEQAAVGWLVVFDDVDGDDRARIRFPGGPDWSPVDVAAEGVDVLLGVATDHAVAFAAQDLATAGGLARILGWPLEAGTWTMGVHRDDGHDLLAPTVHRERVPIYLLLRDGVLCCGDVACADGVGCPTFQGQGDRVD